MAFNHDSQEAASGLAAVCPSNPHLRAPLAWVLLYLLPPQQLQAGAGSPAGPALVQVLHSSCWPLGKGWCPHPPGMSPQSRTDKREMLNYSQSRDCIFSLVLWILFGSHRIIERKG